MLQSWITQLSAVALLVICGYALIAGSWRERFGAVIYVAAYALTLGFGLISLDSDLPYLAKYISSNYTALYMLVTDTLILQGLCVVAWKSPHPWSKWAILCQVVSIGLHCVVLLDLGLSNRIYLSLVTALGWGGLLALLIGTIAARQARQDARRGQAVPVASE
ncbi:hypothetical protein ABAC460_05890 [Asticcacaulis sp. AC460]|uniref:hypothetical protein n=1 Tax=Asticcacaulis sp. AC460 TaxID=1282360 RepID=UPI0003C3C1CA|nr:hypothetical protein [Asticcacaulis sp. AC460]ESQ91513.1 hypothetical protein ABAC460_05890 [Asticcacaulis sp. AC460]